MRIDKKLNLVIPVYGDDEKTPRVYVHSTPVGTDIWEKYWEPVSLAFTRVMTGGHGSVGGPRIADKMLRKVAMELGVWDTPDGVERGLIAEIHRLTLVLAPADKGWETIPFDEAKKRAVLSPEDAAEIEGALCFFCLIYLMHRKSIRQQMLEVAMQLWGAQIESLGSTEFTNSLPTSTEGASTGATVAA